MNRPPPLHAPWTVLGRRAIYSAPPFLDVSVESVRLPDGRVVGDFHQVRMPDFALVAPQLEDGRVLLLRQYKHGVRSVGLHAPGGLVAEGEEPLAAVQRELLEETGYRARAWRSLGSYVCNANQGCGRAHFFAADRAWPAAPPDSGDLEHAELVLLSADELRQALARGEIDSLASVAALALAFGAWFAPCP